MNLTELPVLEDTLAAVASAAVTSSKPIASLSDPRIAQFVHPSTPKRFRKGTAVFVEDTMKQVQSENELPEQAPTISKKAVEKTNREHAKQSLIETRLNNRAKLHETNRAIHLAAISWHDAGSPYPGRPLQPPPRFLASVSVQHSGINLEGFTNINAEENVVGAKIETSFALQSPCYADASKPQIHDAVEQHPVVSNEHEPSRHHDAPQTSRGSERYRHDPYSAVPVHYVTKLSMSMLEAAAEVCTARDSTPTKACERFDCSESPLVQAFGRKQPPRVLQWSEEPWDVRGQ